MSDRMTNCRWHFFAFDVTAIMDGCDRMTNVRLYRDRWTFWA
jgi:hypothetical protein